MSCYWFPKTNGQNEELYFVLIVIESGHGVKNIERQNAGKEIRNQFLYSACSPVYVNCS